MEARRQELAEAESFLRSADTISENDILTAVRTLNAEVYQAVKQMAEGCCMVDVNVDQSALERMKRSSGPALTDLLSTHPPRADDRIVLEMALQGTITSYLAHIISSWMLEPEGNRGIQTIYKRMLQSGKYQTITKMADYSRYLLQNRNASLVDGAHCVANTPRPG